MQSPIPPVVAAASAVLVLMLGLCASPVRGTEAVGLIFDTDICGDCDDVLALGMIHALQSRGQCRLLAVTISADHELAASFVDAVNTFYGRGEIPIGIVGKGGVVEKSAFLSLVEEKENETGQLRYPHALRSGAPVKSATDVLRATLAAQPDRSVVIVQVGFSTNLARLLDSLPDPHSPLPGRDLVLRKVRLLSLMAGAFQSIDGNRHFLEYNVIKDIASARTLAERWPTPMIYSGFEIGIALPYPAVSIERDYGYVKYHPLAEAYIRHNPPPHNRPTWDLTSVLHAVLGDRGYFDLSPAGIVTIEPDGWTRFEQTSQGTHRYLILRPEARPRVLEALVQLSSQPPSRNEDTSRVSKSFPATGVDTVVLRAESAGTAEVVSVPGSRAVTVSGLPEGGAAGYHPADPNWRETPASQWGLDFQATAFGRTLVISSVAEMSYIHHYYHLARIQITVPQGVKIIKENRKLTGDRSPDFAEPVAQ